MFGFHFGTQPSVTCHHPGAFTVRRKSAKCFYSALLGDAGFGMRRIENPRVGGSIPYVLNEGAFPGNPHCKEQSVETASSRAVGATCSREARNLTKALVPATPAGSSCAERPHSEDQPRISS
jgi:hypothetical protein